MRFVVSVWNEFANEIEFEEVIPLEFNGRRLAQLGEPNRIDVLVLEGYERFSESYIGRLRELGYTLHDCRALAQEHAAHLPVFVKHYRKWGDIKHYALLRFLIIPRMFPGESIITFDGDIVLNSGLGEIEAAVGGRHYFLSRSPSFGSIPAGSDFFEIFAEHLSRAHKDPQAYARDVLRLSDVADLLDPIRSGGTDQAFLRHLQDNGFIDFDHEPLPGVNLFAFDWLNIHRLGLAPYMYERRSGVDYINGKKIMVSHMSHDSWVYFWQPMMLSKLFGREALNAFGRIPHLYPHVEQGEANAELRDFLVRVYDAFRKKQAAIPTGLNHFSRGAVIRHYYMESNFGDILNDRLWHTPGVLGNPPGGRDSRAANM